MQPKSQKREANSHNLEQLHRKRSFKDIHTPKEGKSTIRYPLNKKVATKQHEKLKTSNNIKATHLKTQEP